MPQLRHSLPFSRTAQGVLLGLLCGLFALALGALGWMRPAEMSLSALLFRLRGPLMPEPAVMLVVADDETVSRTGPWPLPRREYAEIIRWLHRAGARTIALDLLLVTPSDEENDQILARACREAGNVVQSAAFHVHAVQNPLLPVSIEASNTPPQRFQVTQQGASLRSASWATIAIQPLLSSARALGHVNIHPERDGTLRRIPHLIAYRDGVYPSLALAAAAAFEGKKPNEIVAVPGGVRVADHFVPLDENGEAWINWVGGNRSFPTYSFNELRDGHVKPELFRNRVVLIGATAAGTFEHRPTPFSPVQPAIELQANALENILQDRVLQVWPGWALALITLALGAATGGLMAPHRAPGNTLLLFLLGFVSLMGALAALQSDIYIPLAVPLAAGALTYALTVTLNYRYEWEANWRTDAAVGALARGGALMASGRERRQLRSVLCEIAREALGAQYVFLVSQETQPRETILGTPLSEALNHVAARAIEDNRMLLWPPPREKNPPASSPILEPPSVECDEKMAWLWAKLAELPAGALEHNLPRAMPGLTLVEETTGRSSVATLLATPLPGHSDALIVAGRTRGSEFTIRDALLLETLAEQGTLALDNLEYYEQLRGRVEAADRDLRETYNLLVEQSTKLLAAVENIDSAMIVTDANGHAIFVNTASRAILREAAPALNEPVKETLRRNGLEEFARLLEQTDERRHSCEIELKSHGEARRILLAQRTYLGEAGSTALGDMLMVSDVTAERELEQMKTEFVSFVAHELRSPLSTIYGYASLLQTDAERFAPEDRAQMTASIANQCKRLNRVINEMLDVSRMEAGHPLSINPQPLDLAALCEKVLQDARAALPPTTRHVLILRSEKTPFRISADSDRLEQILTNLVSNAVKYSPEGGNVIIALSSAGENMQIRVSDEGIGLTPEQIPQVFEKYYRTRSAQQSNIKGTGLGLFLVQRLVEAHQGSISVESTPGKGTTFCITLPEKAISPS